MSQATFQHLERSSRTTCGSPDAATLCIIIDSIKAFRVQPLVRCFWASYKGYPNFKNCRRSETNFWLLQLLQGSSTLLADLRVTTICSSIDMPLSRVSRSIDAISSREYSSIFVIRNHLLRVIIKQLRSISNIQLEKLWCAQIADINKLTNKNGLLTNKTFFQFPRWIFNRSSVGVEIK